MLSTGKELMEEASAMDKSELDYKDFCMRFMANVRHMGELQIELVEACEERVTARLPHSDFLVGNPITGALHGGAIFTLMDQVCSFSIFCRLLPEINITPTLDLRLDHLRAPDPGKAIMGTAECYRLTSEVAFTQGYAWQDDPESPVSRCMGTFMRINLDTARRVDS